MALLAALARDSERPLVMVVDRPDRALALLEELMLWAPGLNLQHFAEPNPLPYERSAWGPRTRMQRLQALSALVTAEQGGRAPVVVTSVRGLLTRTLPPREFRLSSRVLRVGTTVKVNQLLAGWLGSGYSAETVVTAPGQFSRRGGIIDVWPPTDLYPVRVELFGDEIEHIRRFDPATQRSGDGVERVVLPLAREALPKAGPNAAAALAGQPVVDLDVREEIETLGQGAAFPNLEYYLPWLYRGESGLLDYLPENALVVVDDPEMTAATARELMGQAEQLRAEMVSAGRLAADAPPATLDWAALEGQLAGFTTVAVRSGQADEVVVLEDAEALDFSAHFKALPRFGGQVKLVMDHLLELAVTGQRAVVVSRQAARLADLWRETSGREVDLPEALPGIPEVGQTAFVLNTLEAGWLCMPDVHLFTDAEIFGWRRPEPRRVRVAMLPPIHTPEDALELTDFTPGEIVVHVEYGIGRYVGLVIRPHEGLEREFLQVEYAGGAMLHVPIHHADRLSRYVGVDDSTPPLSKLGTSDWRQTRERTRKAIEDVAREMLALYARRETSPGFAFPADDVWQREMEASFPYVETGDQITAIGAVKGDMQRGRPMDRLICGDVGYGKTEVALRAAFKAVMAGKQVAVLVPTTILAQQHFNTFSQRLAAFPVQVEMLSRFRSEKEQNAIVRRLSVGELDIVIGTHRILSGDVQFKDLGLVIIDEEQRFGVKHKERYKQLRTEVDVLTLTATPIPRTLYLSLAGVRDISTINTPPAERLPVMTHVGPWEDGLVRRAILRELDRGGQVFVVHNRVQTIETVKKRLEKLLPGLRIAVGHGQMDEHQLAQVMAQFNEHEVDVLLSTTIIESGLDIPNANTLIVDRADMFGLAQLYQLRGRVGRGANRAYAYFLYTAGLKMTPEARMRLDTLAEETELGAGYNIAMRDLEIRGAGDILGLRQHGQIQLVGFHLYTRLLRQAVTRLKRAWDNAEKDGEVTDGLPGLDLTLSLVSVDLPLAVNLPEDYVGDRNLRLKLYRRMAAIGNEVELDEMAAELRDRFGALPVATENLLYQLRVKLKAHAAGVESITHDSGQIVVHYHLWNDPENQRRVASYVPTKAKVYKGRVLLPRDPKPAVWQRELVLMLEDLGRVTYPHPYVQVEEEG